MHVVAPNLSPNPRRPARAPGQARRAPRWPRRRARRPTPPARRSPLGRLLDAPRGSSARSPAPQLPLTSARPVHDCELCTAALTDLRASRVVTGAAFRCNDPHPRSRTAQRARVRAWAPSPSVLPRRERGARAVGRNGRKSTTCVPRGVGGSAWEPTAWVRRSACTSGTRTALTGGPKLEPWILGGGF